MFLKEEPKSHHNRTKLDDLKAAIALHFARYYFVRVHQTLRITPARASSLTDHLWTLYELLSVTVSQRSYFGIVPFRTFLNFNRNISGRAIIGGDVYVKFENVLSLNDSQDVVGRAFKAEIYVLIETAKPQKI